MTDNIYRMNNTMLYITDLPPAIFFKRYILRICDEADVDTIGKFLQIDYLSRMLSAYVDPERHFGDKGELIYLIDSLKGGTDLRHETIEGYKKAADRILFYHSFFPEAFKARLVNVKFYAKAAKSLYQIVGRFNMPVCSLLSEEYALWNSVLRTAKMKYMF